MKKQIILTIIALLAISVSAMAQGSNQNPDYVDVGLPSGTLWATMNVGANSPEESGSYFAWGETAPKQEYEWNTYELCYGNYGSYSVSYKMTKYGSQDNKTELDPADDAATANWGSSWQMPSEMQINELRKECSWQWTTKNGVKGYLVTSKRNNASLFLPAAGERSYGRLENVGYFGHYWSRNLYTSSSGNYSGATTLHFHPTSVHTSSPQRRVGLCVRAVRTSRK